MIEIKETTTYWIGAAVMAAAGIGTWILQPFQTVQGATAVVTASLLMIAIQALHHVHLVQYPRTEYLEKSGEQQ